jgi:uncharacterized protein
LSKSVAASEVVGPGREEGHGFERARLQACRNDLERVAALAAEGNLQGLHDRAKFVMLQLLRAYKWAISPMLPPSCRYVPTCSEYAMEAVERFGVLRGSWMAFTRILRCHPFVRGGYDPVVNHQPTSNDQRPATHSHRAYQGNL